MPPKRAPKGLKDKHPRPKIMKKTDFGKIRINPPKHTKHPRTDKKGGSSAKKMNKSKRKLKKYKPLLITTALALAFLILLFTPTRYRYVYVENRIYENVYVPLERTIQMKSIVENENYTEYLGACVTNKTDTPIVIIDFRRGICVDCATREYKYLDVHCHYDSGDSVSFPISLSGNSTLKLYFTPPIPTTWFYYFDCHIENSSNRVSIWPNGWEVS